MVAVIGDGSFCYSVQSIWIAAQHELPVVVPLLQHDEYAIFKSFAKQE